MSPSSSTNLEPVEASSACARLAIKTTRSFARPSTIRNKRRSSSSRARLRSDCDTSLSSASRSNIGSGRERLGKFPSTVPTTITVWNSRPAAPWAVRTWTASASRRSHAENPGPRSPASTDARNASTEGSAAEPASATALENATTESSSRRDSTEAPASSTKRREHANSRQRTENVSSTERSAAFAARSNTPLTSSTCAASCAVRPSVNSSALPTEPVSAWATRRRPRAAAGERRTRSDVSTDSIKPLRSSSDATSQRSARTNGLVAGS